jgi:hypothetical protein
MAPGQQSATNTIGSVSEPRAKASGAAMCNRIYEIVYEGTSFAYRRSPSLPITSRRAFTGAELLWGVSFARGPWFVPLFFATVVPAIRLPLAPGRLFAFDDVPPGPLFVTDLP